MRHAVFQPAPSGGLDLRAGTELLQRIATELPALDRVALALAQPRAIAPRISDELDEGATTHAASEVTTLEGFDVVIGAPGRSRTVQGLRPQLRVEPLVALALRIHRLAPEDRPSAIKIFHSQVDALEAADRTDRLAALARVAGHATAEEAVAAGENILDAVDFHGVTSPAEIDDLELIAIRRKAPNSAAIAVGAGQNVEVVARLHGITTLNGINDLRLIARTSAGNQAGRSVSIATSAVGP